MSLLVAEAGLEHATSRLWAWRATNCSTPRCSVCFLFASAKLALYRQSTKYIPIFFQTKHQYYYRRIIQPSNIQAITINSFVKLFFQKPLFSSNINIAQKIKTALLRPWNQCNIHIISTSTAKGGHLQSSRKHTPIIKNNTLLLSYVYRDDRKNSVHYRIIL